MFKKKYEFEDERRDMPEILKLLIAIVVLGAMIWGINCFCDYLDRVEMESQYPNELVID